MDNNTKLRIRVPKSLYESIKAELAEKEEDKEEKSYKGMAMGKKDILNKLGKGKTNTVKGDKAKAYVAPHAQKTNEAEADFQTASLEDIATAMDKALDFAKKLGQQIAAKKGGKLTQKDQGRIVDNFRSKVREYSPLKPEMEEGYSSDAQRKAVWASRNDEGDMHEWVGLNPNMDTLTLMLGLAVPVLTAIIAAGPKAVGQAAWQAAKDALSKKQKGGESEPPVAEKKDDLYEALKRIMEKKEMDKKAKKKKEMEEKKKADEKKKKEAEEKKKAADKKK